MVEFSDRSLQGIFNKKVVSHYILFVLLLFFSAIKTTCVYSQDPCKGKHDVKTVFGGLAGGEINIRNHLDDSLYFTDDCINKDWEIVTFHLALKCNGNVLKYLENKNGNQLTEEMKLAVLDLLPDCTLTFDGIKSRTRWRNPGNRYYDMDFGMLKFTLVQ